MKVKIKTIGKTIFIALCVFCVYGCINQKDGGRMVDTDYSAADNWLSQPIGDKSVDVFFLYPTCYYEGSEEWCAVTDESMRAEAIKIKEAHEGIFDAANFYAPFYRQLRLDFFFNVTTDKIFEALEKAPLADAKNAFEYFLENKNNGKPIIFASHSQGSITASQLLLWIKKEHPDVLERVIAVYLIGYPVTKEYCDALGLPYTAGRNDTGVVVSWNTESMEAAELNSINPFIAALPGAIAINPINWKRDETYASKEESLGSRVRFNGQPAVDRPHFADAMVNLERHTVVTNADIKVEAPWPAGILHRYDFDLFYYDFKQNVDDRIAAYKISH